MNNLSTIPYMYNPIGVTEPLDKRKLSYLLGKKHQVEFTERFKWKNLPPELNQDLIERIIYYRGKGALFKGLDDKYRFLPFTLSGNIDVYGRYISIIPVLFTGQNNEVMNRAENGKPKRNDKLDTYFQSDKELTVCYEKGGEGEAVILTDMTLSISQDNVASVVSITPLIEQLTEILVLINIDLISSAKVFYIVANDEAQKEAIEAEFEGIDAKILNGKRVIVIDGKGTDLQELMGNSNNSKDSNRYFQVYQSFENLRKDILGMPNSGTFMKMSIQTDSEVEQNKSSGSPVLENALRQRKEFCEIVNSVFGLSIDVEVSETEEPELIGVSSNNSDRNDGIIEEDE